MKLYDKQKFEVSEVPWQYLQGQPQGTIHALSPNGNPIAVIKPKDWSLPAWERDNSVLLTRQGPGHKWKEHELSSVSDAIRKGTKHVKEFKQDRQIAALESALKDQPKAIKATNDKGQKPPKLRTAKALMEWQKKQKAEGKDTNPNTAFGQNPNQDMGV